ncbi:MAG TPA: HAD family phosphatase, partial [Candidatus Aquilonibacter sp.]|nr:HAD family phosphatase [Candidatus Aquilonibacter sp.]
RLDYDLGHLAGRTYWQTVADDLDRSLTAETLSALIAADLDLWTVPNQPMIDWAAALQRHALLTGILSNMGDVMEEGIMARLAWMATFPVRIFSHRLGLAKPDERIYRHAISALGVAPDEILFLDDRLENVEAARALGLHAIHYSSHGDLQRAFVAAGFTGLPQPPAGPSIQ